MAVVVLSLIVFGGVIVAVEYTSPTMTYADTIFNNSYFINTTNGAPNTTSLIDFDNSLVGWWRFNDGTATDYSTYQNNGTIHGGGTQTETTVLNNGSVLTFSETVENWTSASFLQSVYLDFDGIDDYVDYGDDPSINTRDNNFTVMAFVYPDNLTTTSRRDIVTKSQAGDREFILSTRETNRSNLIVWTDAGSVHYIATGAVKHVGQWSHIAGTVTPISASMYDDGLSSGSDTTSAGSRDLGGTSNLYVGDIVSASAGELSWDGRIDDVRIYNKSLDTKQIRRIWNESIYGSNRGKSIPVLSYHKIEAVADVSTEVTLTDFTEQMTWLNDQGYETITYDNYYDWRNNAYLLPEKPIILVFDDGWLSVYDSATPVMDGFGFIGVASIISDKAASASNYMSWSQIVDLNVKGWQIAGHSFNATSVTDLSASEQTRAFTQVKADILGNVSITPSLFIYPNNANTDATDTECATYYTMCSGQSGSTNTQESFLFKTANLTHEDGAPVGMRRILVLNTTTMTDFKNAIDYHEDLIFHSRMNENTGATTYDQTTNGNNGTLSGPIWADDGTDINLTKDIDYLQDQDTFTLINHEYSWMNITTDYDFYGAKNTTGKFGNALSFDGVNDYVNLPYSVLNQMTTMTISSWVYASKYSHSPAIYTYNNNGAKMIIASDGRLYCQAYNGSRDTTAYGGIIQLNSWNHVVCTINYDLVLNRTTVQSWSNGVGGSSSYQLNTVVTGTSGVSIGSVWKASQWFNGTIDDVQIHNRALSSEEIQASYNSGLYRLYHNFTDLAEGKHNYTSYEQDTDGNVTTLSRVEFLIDAVNPYDQDHNDSLVKPIVSYPLDEATGTTAKDVFGNITATVNDGEWNTTGKCNTSSLKFRSRDPDHLDIPHDTALTFTGRSNFTIEMWANFHNASDCEIMSKGDNDDGYRLRKYTDNKLYFYIPNAVDNFYYVNSTVAITENEWVMINMAYNSTDMLIYLNGTLANTINNTVGVGASTTDLKFGNGPIWGSACNASIQLIRIYNETLNASIIEEHYNDPCRANTISSFISEEEEQEEDSSPSSSTPDTCENGELDDGEDGVDCGGICSLPCASKVIPDVTYEDGIVVMNLGTILDSIYNSILSIIEYIRVCLRGFING